MHYAETTETVLSFLYTAPPPGSWQLDTIIKWIMHAWSQQLCLVLGWWLMETGKRSSKGVMIKPTKGFGSCEVNCSKVLHE